MPDKKGTFGKSFWEQLLSLLDQSIAFISQYRTKSSLYHRKAQSYFELYHPYTELAQNISHLGKHRKHSLRYQGSRVQNNEEKGLLKGRFRFNLAQLF